MTLSGASTDTIYQSLLREIHDVDTDERVDADYSTVRTVTVTAQDGLGDTSATGISSISLTDGADQTSALASQSQHMSGFCFIDAEAKATVATPSRSKRDRRSWPLPERMAWLAGADGIGDDVASTLVRFYAPER